MKETLVFGESLVGNIAQNCDVPESRQGVFPVDFANCRVLMNELNLTLEGNSVMNFGANDLYFVVMMLQVQSLAEEANRGFMSMQAFDTINTSVPLAHGCAVGGSFMLPATDFHTFSGMGTFSPAASGGARLFGHFYLHRPSNFRFMMRFTQLN